MSHVEEGPLRDGDDPVADFLAQKDNLRIALQIAEALDRAREKLVCRLWDAVARNIQIRLDESGIAAWTPKTSFDGYGWNGVELVPSHLRATAPCWKPIAWHEEDSRGIHIWQGITLPEGWAKGSDKLIAGVKKSLLAKGYRKGPNHLGYKEVLAYPQFEDFLLDLADATEGVATMVAETLWDLFIVVKDDLKTANEQLSGTPE